VPEQFLGERVLATAPPYPTLLLSLPDAILTKAYVPILMFGGFAGVVIGPVVQHWGT